MFGRTNHIWVEGEGMLHALYFQKGSSSDGEWSVFYNNRHLETETFKMEKDRAKPSFIPAVEGHALAILSAHLFNWMRFGKVNKDLSNTDVVVHGGKFYAVAETHAAQEFDILTLDAIGEWDINGAWDRPFTAHPKVRFCQPQPACRFISSFPAWFCSCMYIYGNDLHAESSGYRRASHIWDAGLQTVHRTGSCFWYVRTTLS
ncbi:unnamed protein product [Linum tenue]|uniref:Uncharacterized protein n=1 Tax=Linum tenue TaxID=586396 RepID=A0AAV0HNL1_9ROSI|nr:unnamed protein product [Linum tenue]